MPAFSPMKAPSTSIKEEDIVFPVLASPKLDGYRAYYDGGGLSSKAGKAFPNRHVNILFDNLPQLEGMDGELIVGEPTGEDVIRRTGSGVMTKTGEPDVKWYVFDDFSHPDQTFSERYKRLAARVKALPADLRKRIKLVPHYLIVTLDELLALEERTLAEGYEGLMLRHPRGGYKFGRATEKEGTLFKFKRFVDSEALVIGLEEGMINGNERKADGKRRTLKANMTPSGLVGTLLCQDVKTNQVIRVAPGRLTREERAHYWACPAELVGETITYRHFPTGTMNAPRFPIYHCRRPAGI